MEIEDNKKNPTIVFGKKIDSPNYFLIKYKSEEERKKFSQIVIDIVKTHEIRDFHVEEKKAFVQNRILYNMHTIAIGNRINFPDTERVFLRHYG